jgi:prepilin-type N-terminal cleavage/methylation domain-containing protein
MARGDTLVEVLMSIAIVGAVIAGAYALASRSLAEGVSASEHSQAIKLAEAQVEALKSRSKDAAGDLPKWDGTYNITSNPIPAAQNNFCLDTTAISITAANWNPQKNGDTTFTGNNLAAGTGPNQYNPVCTSDGGAGGGAAKYFINVNLTPTNNIPTYLVTVRWTPAGRGPTSQTQLYYRF